MEECFINTDGRRWMVRSYLDPPSIKGNTTRFQLILASCKLKTSEFQSGDGVVKKVLTLFISMMTNKVM